ncbi:MAG: hypothetical protein K8F59_03145 [Rhodobacteraceae bacterium]|nr:hypothetical protein [Paracoccaceae bacterium]
MPFSNSLYAATAMALVTASGALADNLVIATVKVVSRRWWKFEGGVISG